jgi:hypothetical protein
MAIPACRLVQRKRLKGAALADPVVALQVRRRASSFGKAHNVFSFTSLSRQTSSACATPIRFRFSCSVQFLQTLDLNDVHVPYSTCHR